MIKAFLFYKQPGTEFGKPVYSNIIDYNCSKGGELSDPEPKKGEEEEDDE